MSTPRLLREKKPILTAINIAAAFFILWATLRLLTNCSHPIFIVSSESMEPTFFRGDVILLSNLRRDIQVGDIPVVWFQNRPLPMVHRVVKVAQSTEHDGSDVGQQFLTKGDNNEVDDTVLYPEGRSFVRRDEVVGVVWGYIPFIGRFSLVVQDYPRLLYMLIGSTFLLGTLF